MDLDTPTPEPAWGESRLEVGELVGCLSVKQLLVSVTSLCELANDKSKTSFSSAAGNYMNVSYMYYS